MNQFQVGDIIEVVINDHMKVGKIKAHRKIRKISEYQDGAGLLWWKRSPYEKRSHWAGCCIPENARLITSRKGTIMPDTRHYLRQLEGMT